MPHSPPAWCALPSVDLCRQCRCLTGGGGWGIKYWKLLLIPRVIRGQEDAGGTHPESSAAGRGLTHINSLSAVDLQLIATASPADLRRL